MVSTVAGSNMISADDRELVQQLLEDVGILSGMIGPDKNPTPHAARAIVAPILRRWICERLFYKAQKLVLPHKVQFSIFEFPIAVENCRKGLYEHWIGLLSYNGVGISSLLPRKDLLLPNGQTSIPIAHDPGGSAPIARIGRRFFEQPMFYWEGRLFSRLEILAVHANKLGGVHLDFRRDDDEGHIEELRQHFGLEIKEGPNYQMLVGKELRAAKADPARRLITYDTLELVAVDTAKIFVEGVKVSEPQFTALLA